jgi:methyl-accepting chemotaxis protein
MLAVSGAVEAARSVHGTGHAGDGGRDGARDGARDGGIDGGIDMGGQGFAHVSADIKLLAADAAAGSAQIQDTLEDMQDRVASARQDFERLAAALTAEALRSRQLSPALVRVSEDIEAVRAGNADVRAGSEAILAAVGDVAQGAREISMAAEAAGRAATEAAVAAREQARGAEDLAAAIEEIASLADSLQTAEF